jgi:hypothetical protein
MFFLMRFVTHINLPIWRSGFLAVSFSLATLLPLLLLA